jgi:hypothetical protein
MTFPGIRPSASLSTRCTCVGIPLTAIVAGLSDVIVPSSVYVVGASDIVVAPSLGPVPPEETDVPAVPPSKTEMIVPPPPPLPPAPPLGLLTPAQADTATRSVATKVLRIAQPPLVERNVPSATSSNPRKPWSTSNVDCRASNGGVCEAIDR